ncbi:helix-turn-helix domain-containing protein [Neorhizobium sp. DAR64872/K0K18]|uniref:helix-turn-helix domain-containing protein n=1 Tax=Neorhizobium sp. DAR64872/K0K18 TaxID=3421958 RepID=UPI003D292569
MRPPSKILIAARVLLGRTQAEVAKESGIGARTIFKVEHGAGDVVTVEKLVRHYEENGIEFSFPTGGKGWGLSSLHLLESFDQERYRHRSSKSVSA